MTNKKEPDFSLVESLVDALGDSEGQTVNEVKAELEREGVNVDVVVGELMSFVENCSMAARRKQLDLAGERRREREATRPDLVGKFATWTKEQVFARLQEISDLSDGFLSVSHRELDAMDDEGQKALLEDLEMALHRHESEKDKDGS